MTERKKQYLNILKKAKLFKKLSDDDIFELAQKMYYCEFEKDSTLVYEGEMGNELYIVVEGTVEVSVKAQSKIHNKGGNGEVLTETNSTKTSYEEQSPEDIAVARIEAADFFGEMSMLEQEPRSASCRARSNVKALVLKSKDFLDLIEKKPNLAGKILWNMLETTSERLMSTNSFVTQLIQWGETAKLRAITDHLSGLYNRRYLDAHISDILFEAKSNNQNLCFAMLDIDHFGILNQKYGKEFCDTALLRISEVFRFCFDKNDILLRYGGDEFCFFIRGEPSEALKRCEHVCNNIYALRNMEHPELAVSCSIGLVQYEPKNSADDLIKRADAELYKAKTAGRNRVSSSFS